jgi:uncharacterized LabA/DUF88 family protein
MASLDDARLALFLDFENLALGARDSLSVRFRFAPLADALADRGRVVVRRAYADWSYFDEERRDLARHNVELIEIPQRMGASRKNAADIKLTVDTLELAYSRPWIDTFVLGTGDSDFTPLVHKLRELDKRVVGIGVRDSTSRLLPAACDEFLFYDDLVSDLDGDGDGTAVRGPDAGVDDEGGAGAEATPDLVELVVAALTGLERSGASPVRASELKRAVLRRDPTFSESAYGFRAWGELVRSLAEGDVIHLDDDRDHPGNPVVNLSADSQAQARAFDALVAAVRASGAGDGWASMSGLKHAIVEREPGFAERALGYRSFLEFCRAAQAQGLVTIERAGRQYRVRAA